MQQTRSPARELVSNPFSINSVFSEPFDLIFRIWQVYREADPFGAAEDQYAHFSYPRFPTAECPDAVAAFASFQTQMQRFATQLHWTPQTHHYRIQAKLPPYISRGTAVYQVTHNTAGIAGYYQSLAAFVRNYMNSTNANLPRRNLNPRQNAPTAETMFNHSGQSSVALRTPQFKPSAQPAPQATGTPATDPVRNRCFNCGGQGHFAKDCPSPKAELEAKDKTKPNPKATPATAPAKNRHLYIPPDETNDPDYDLLSDHDSEYEQFEHQSISDESDSGN